MRMITHTIKSMPNGTLELSGICPATNKAWTLTVESESYLQWFNRDMLIQNAFPNLSRDEREMIMTGYTKEGWDMTFGESFSDEV